MKKYIPLDFDEKGKVILGNAKNTPTPNGTIPAIFIPNGSDEEKQGLKSISISPAITTTPALDSLFPIYWDDLTDEEKEEGVLIKVNGTATENQSYTITFTPSSDWYAGYYYNDEPFINGLGESNAVSAIGNSLNVINPTFFAANTNDMDDPELQTVYIDLSISPQG